MFQAHLWPVAFKTWCGHQYRVGIISPPPPVEIGLEWLRKLGVDTSPCPHTYRGNWYLKAFETFHDIMGFKCDFKIHLTPFCDTLFLRSVFYTTRSSQCGISKAIPCTTFKKNIVPMNDIAHFFSSNAILSYDISCPLAIISVTRNINNARCFFWFYFDNKR